ncbi:MAG: tetratricopeptide repeat protein, partial [Gemmatimonadetes bacterium]|nr:tetratricopeptide repeat protein [Gemmatimonadota bacterium]
MKGHSKGRSAAVEPAEGEPKSNQSPQPEGKGSQEQPPADVSSGAEKYVVETQPAPTPGADRVARGEELLAEGNAVQAAEAFSSAIALEPDNVFALLGLGSAMLAQAQYEGAEKEFR